MEGGQFFAQASPIFSLAFQIAELTKKWAELTWAELTKKKKGGGKIDQKVGRTDLGRIDQKVGRLDQGRIGTGPNWLEASPYISSTTVVLTVIN